MHKRGGAGGVKNGSVEFKGLFVCSFVEDNIAGAFPQWSYILESAELVPKGYPRPTEWGAKYMRENMIKNQIQ